MTLGREFDMMKRAEPGIRLPGPALTTAPTLEGVRVMAATYPNVPGVRFKNIPEFPGYYVGDDGSVWSAWRRGAYGKCSIVEGYWYRLKPEAMRPIGHRMVRFCRDGKHHPRLIHRLVLEAFVGPCPPGMEACHFPDRDPANNRRDNLRWDTPSANSLDAIAHGTKQVGQDHPNSKLTNAQVVELRRRFASGETQASLSRSYGVHKKTIRMIVLGKIWKYVS